MASRVTIKEFLTQPSLLPEARSLTAKLDRARDRLEQAEAGKPALSWVVKP